MTLDNAAIFYLSHGSTDMMLAAEAIEVAGKLAAHRRPTKEEERKDRDVTFAGKRDTGYLANRIKRDRQDIASDLQLARALVSNPVRDAKILLGVVLTQVFILMVDIRGSLR